MENNIRVFTVSEADAGTRVDKFIASKMPEYSRSEIQRFEISGSGVRGSGPVKLSDKVKPGEEY